MGLIVKYVDPEGSATTSTAPESIKAAVAAGDTVAVERFIEGMLFAGCHTARVVQIEVKEVVVQQLVETVLFSGGN